jgi:1-acyl-sn-glycerol-3-phosphate acyltransferase
MLRLIFKIAFKLSGWKIEKDFPPGTYRSVLIASPHTSNWDFILALGTFRILRIPAKFTIKIEWLKFPFKSILTYFGAIGIDRTPKNPGKKRLSMVESMAALFKENENLVVMVTPEGTRSLQERWKTGFYYVANLAKVPISLGYLDYKNKIAGVGKIIDSSQDLETVMKEIMAFYADKTAKYPEKFSLDKRYCKD